MAARFERRSLSAVGSPVVAVESVGARPFSGTGWYAVSRSGTLVYASAVGSIDKTLVWVDRSGRSVPVTSRRAAYSAPRLSPDGSRIAVTVYAPDGTPDVWTYDLQHGSLSRLTLEGFNTSGLWSPDGTAMVFTSRRAGDRIFKPWVMPADGSGAARRLLIDDVPSWSTSWSPDGKWLAVSRFSGASGMDVLVMPSDGSGRAQPLAQSGFAEMAGVFSPEGRWIAYMSNESGEFQIYVQSFAQPRRKWQVSVDGGSEPAWSRSGRELFFRHGQRLFGSSIVAQPSGDLRIGTPVILFEGPFDLNTSSGLANFDVGLPPRDFLMVAGGDTTTAQRLTVVLNWFAEIQRRVP
jgi:serine/threonine-protein kinase